MKEILPYVTLFIGKVHLKSKAQEVTKGMLIALTVLIPGLIAAVYYRKMTQAEWQTTELIIHWGIFAFFINMFALGVIYLRGSLNLVEFVFDEILRLLKYGGISLLLAIAMPNLAFLGRRLFCKSNAAPQKEAESINE